MKEMTMVDLLPRDTREALVTIDDLLASMLSARMLSRRSGRMVVPLVVAVEAVEALVGPGSRPVGSGDPGSGRGAVLTSPVERAVGADREELAGPTVEELDLARLRALPAAIMSSTLRCVADAGVSGVIPPPPRLPSGVGGVRRLVWSRWAVRQLVTVLAEPRWQSVRALHDEVVGLDRLVERWTVSRTPASTGELGPVEDLTGMLCRSCLAAGHREQRDDRYAADGVCRWCGDFQASQGWWPTRNLVRARQAGKRVTDAMIRAERPRSKRKRRR